MVLSSPVLTTACPVCNTTCTDRPLYHYTATDAATYFCPPTRNLDRHQRLEATIRKLWQGNDCHILRCQNCGFGFGYPFVGGDEEFYSILHEQHGYPGWRWDYDIALQKAVQIKGKGRILDIGAGTGQFLNSLGSEWDCYAIEGSETTRQKLKQSGIQVFPELATAVQTKAKTFSIITLFQVLEHIADFQQILSQCHELLEPGGIIVVTVPNFETLVIQEAVTGCPDMPPNHINKWTEKSLTHALQDSGFTPEPALFEPRSWKRVPYMMQLKVMSDATRSRSLSAQIYRVQNAKIRRVLLSLLGISALVQMSPHFGKLNRGAVLCVVATAL
ncbi:MAG: class I SAM-dependent methyltransferase [Leptolyngbyaceae cyanobacterium SU_3_3]|nr:class I SAM-dependent methyltransferase [Leptolyngbyaceae cyanobacterium SU_3_3]NJR49056.1 class I SAM-dependent methyltransferase [Leptolyngbyaceae cyanobacterium CSU_1_3]